MPSGTSLGGLTANQVYTVRALNPYTIQLVAPNAVTSSPTVANVFGATISVANSFANGDAVTYHAPPLKTFLASQVDIAVTRATSTTPTTVADAPSAENIYFYDDAGHGFANGELLVYAVSGSPAIGGLVNGTTYRAQTIDAYSLQLKPTVTTTLQFVKAVGGTSPANAKIIGTDWAARGFRIGDDVAISGSAGAAGNNVSRTVLAINGTTLEVGGDFATAETVIKTADGNRAIPINVAVANRQSTATHSLVRPGEQKFSNLVDGQTYYVVGQSAIGYQISDTVGGAAKTLGSAGLTGATVHRFARESVDLTAPAAASTHEFRIDITGGVSGTQRIVGPGGVSLAGLKPPPGDAVSTAAATGSGKGIFFGSAGNTSTSTTTASVTAYIASASLATTPLANPSAAQGQVSVLADSTTNARATVSNSAGGFVGVGKADASTPQTSTTSAFIAGSSVIGAGGDVTVRAKSNHITDGNARADSGGFAADVRANMTSVATYNTTASLKSGAKIVSAGHVDVSSVADAQGTPKSSADGRGFGGGGYANTNYTLTGSSLVDIGANAVVTGNSASLRAITADMTITTEAKGWGAGFVGVSVDNSNLTVTSTNTVTLGSGAAITGYNGVDLEATFRGIDTYAYSYAEVLGVFGYLESNRNNNTTLTSSVIGDPRTNPRAARALVTAGPRSAGNAKLGHPTGDAATLDHLALYVNTTNQIDRIDGKGEYSRRALAAGGVGGSINNVQKRSVDWNADVMIFSGQSPELEIAEIVIDDTGKIVKATNASVATAASSAQTSGTIATAETQIFVNDIVNKDPGQAYFDNSVDTSTDATGRSNAGSSTLNIGGSGGHWTFSDTFRQVLITNSWNRQLTINNIDVVNTKHDPLVDLNGPNIFAPTTNIPFTFSIDRTVAPTLVQILNLAPSDIVLNGTINNPIGATVIRNSGGSIVAARERGVAETSTRRVSLVTTAILDLHADAAGKSIGSAATRVNVDMIYSDVALPSTTFRSSDVAALADAVFLGSASLFSGELVRYQTNGAAIGGLVNGNYYTVIRSASGASIQLATKVGNTLTVVDLDPSTSPDTVVHTLTAAQHAVASAGNDIYLDLKSHLRAEPAVTEFTATIDSLTAGRTLDVLLQDSVQEIGAGANAGVRVTTLQETTTPLVPGVRDSSFKTFFRPDGSSMPSRNLAAFGGTEALRNSTYDFRNLDATGGRTVAGLIAGGAAAGSTGNIVVNDVQGKADGTVNGAAGLAAPTLHLLGLSDLLGTGHVDINVDGKVTLAETAGDLRVGLIRSRGNDVSLESQRASIVDAATGDGANPLGDTTPDVVGINITLKAFASIGSATNFLEIDSSNKDGAVFNGVLNADAGASAWIEETHGDLRVERVIARGTDGLAHVTLVARAGSILDANAAEESDGDSTATRVRDVANVVGKEIDLAASVDIGALLDDLDIDSGVLGANLVTGRLFAQAGNSVYTTESARELNILAVRALGGDVRLTVPDTNAADTENLVLLAGGGGATARVAESAATAVPQGEITAFATVLLWVGDNVTTSAASRIAAGTGITIRGDTRRVGKTNNVDTTDADDGRGTQMVLRGTIGNINAPASLATFNVNSKTFTEIYGHLDVDTFTFDQTRLDANTRVYGSYLNAATLADDGEDRFIVNQLQSMHVFADGSGDTLTLDGQADTDTYIVYTTGSQSASTHNYVINVLDSGARDDGVDRLQVYGVDGSEAPGAIDDIFLLRRVASIPNEPLADSPAFVALLHGTLAQARDGSGTLTGRSQDVQRVNYDARLNGRLEVYGLGGNDYFAMDDNSAITTLDGGSGADQFQIGQLYGSQRVVPNLPANDAFNLIATTRGYLSRGATMPVVVQGGAGNDTIQVYSNKAELRLEGDDGDDLFVIRGFALAQTDSAGNILKDANGVAIPLLTGETSTLTVSLPRLPMTRVITPTGVPRM